METQQNPIVKNVEELIGKISKGNTVAISEITKFLGQLTSSKLNIQDLMSLEKRVLTDTVNQLIALNTRYASDMIDVLVGIAKNLNSNPYKTNGFGQAQPPVTAAPKPVFEISISADAGGTAATAFMLNSVNPAAINCRIGYSEFTAEDHPENKFYPEIVFTPQVFELLPGVARKIEALLKIPAATAPGVYRGRVTVDGFEDTFFEFALSVNPAKKIKDPEPVVPAKPAKKAAPVQTRATAKKAAAKK